jgi:hypothetical protein
MGGGLANNPATGHYLAAARTAAFTGKQFECR